ncbi:alpha-ketoglutarate-dependent dioxygenase AlkB family protein [Rothia nasisuis]|uniref:alpha-ketoglutarate-dependent dioxygenase AlkB family protein n=1 Tax=Rothia nasisuis TaxID=2109647 RepID=UPI001F26B0BC|nr:alpha-ketoglutarate-dependent dioxygenase AlkB [Rothia nasisuis]
MHSDALFGPSEVSSGSLELPEGAFYVPAFLSLEQQAWIVGRFQEWGQGPVPPHSTLIAGHPMSVKTVCLGWHWSPSSYTRIAHDVNGQPVPPVPDWLVRLGRRALGVATGDFEQAEAYTPDVALVNFYQKESTMGMHQDKDEKSSAPVVSLSIGDSCLFRLGNTLTRSKPYRDLILNSGDLFVFGGPSRFAFHGVRKVYERTAPGGCGLPSGRINITLRETGF